MSRSAQMQRTTAETEIDLSLCLDGSGRAEVVTGIGFFDHMLTLFAAHAAIDLKLRAVGDLNVDQHHTVEDVGICLGQAVRAALGEKRGIRRYGHFTLPMDETLVTAAIDFGGRPFLVFEAPMPVPRIGEFQAELLSEFWQAFAVNAACNLHLILHHGRNAHHIAEGLFKAAARAMRMAVEIDPRTPGIPSTKGVL